MTALCIPPRQSFALVARLALAASLGVASTELVGCDIVLTGNSNALAGHVVSFFCYH